MKKSDVQDWLYKWGGAGTVGLETETEIANYCMALIETNGLLKSITEERGRQDKKWGPNRDLPNGRWLQITIEELGEACAADLDGEGADRVIEELVQAAAVIVAWIENLHRR